MSSLYCNHVYEEVWLSFSHLSVHSHFRRQLFPVPLPDPLQELLLHNLQSCVLMQESLCQKVSYGRCCILHAFYHSVHRLPLHQSQFHNDALRQQLLLSLLFRKQSILSFPLPELHTWEQSFPSMRRSCVPLQGSLPSESLHDILYTLYAFCLLLYRLQSYQYLDHHKSMRFPYDLS